MKETFVADVTAFMEAAGQSTEGFNTRQTALYLGLQMEELAEKLGALLFFDDSLAHTLEDWADRFKSGELDFTIPQGDLRVDMLDADIDLMWVTVGAALSSGADVLGAMKEVARSNMSKTVDGKMIRDANGKVIKGPNYSPPALSPFVAQ